MSTLAEIAKIEIKPKNWRKVVSVSPDGFYAENPTGKKWYVEKPIREDWDLTRLPKTKGQRISPVICIFINILAKIQKKEKALYSNLDKKYYNILKRTR